MEEVLKLTPQSILKLKNSRPIAVCWAGFYGKVCFDILQSHMVHIILPKVLALPNIAACLYMI